MELSTRTAYTLSATIFAISFGELILPTLFGSEPSPTILSSYGTAVAMVAYYGLISYIFALIIDKYSTKTALASFFIYGSIVELILFLNVIDIVGFLFFGVLYIFLFGVPMWFTKKYF